MCQEKVHEMAVYSVKGEKFNIIGIQSKVAEEIK